MGYTHYMRNKPAFTETQWAAFCNDVRKLLNKSKVPLANAAGDKGTKPYFGRAEVSFNGVEDNSHETCYIPKGASEFEFCKTARKPYDPVVVEVYKLVRKYLPTTVLSSDGGPKVFSSVVMVQPERGKALTYLTGDFKVKVGDTVILPPLPYGDGGEWTAKVIATESDYEGELKEILGVEEEIETPPLKEELAKILSDYGVEDGDLDDAVDFILGVVIAHIKK
jgi:hypothetical protein